MLKWRGDFTLPRLRANLARKYEFHPKVEPMYDEYYSLYLGKSTVERRPSKPDLRPDPGRVNLNRPEKNNKMTKSSSVASLPSLSDSAASHEHERETPQVESASRRLWGAAHGSVHYIKEAIEAAAEDPKAMNLKTAAVPGIQKALKEGAKLDWRNEEWNGATLFIKCARFGEDTLLQYLEALGADRFLVDWSQRSALHWAALEGYAKTSAWLLERFPPEMVDMRDDMGDSALHFSARHGHLPIVRLLVRAKADPEALNHANETPISIAASRRCHHIVRFLEDCKRTPDTVEMKLSDLDRDSSVQYAVKVRAEYLENKPKPKAKPKAKK